MEECSMTPPCECECTLKQELKTICNKTLLFIRSISKEREVETLSLMQRLKSHKSARQYAVALLLQQHISNKLKTCLVLMWKIWRIAS